MKLALVILVVALVALTWRLHSVNATLGEQQQQIQTLNWTRTQQCAVQADKLVSRFRLDEYPDSLTLNSRRNHYSTTDGRCYVLLERDRAPNAFKYRREMWDAFEERLVATCDDVPEFPIGCQIEERGRGNVSCDVCRSFISERMTK